MGGMGGMGGFGGMPNGLDLEKENVGVKWSELSTLSKVWATVKNGLKISEKYLFVMLVPGVVYLGKRKDANTSWFDIALKFLPFV